jgi:hypothetical protein
MAEATPAWVYTIRVEGSLSPEWQDWFGGMEILPAGKETLLKGVLPDLAAVYGVLNHLYGLNLALISVERKTVDAKSG